MAKNFPFHSTNHCPSCRQGLKSYGKKELKVSTDHSNQRREWLIRSLQINRARICRPFKEPRLHRLAESIPRNRFLGSINVYKYGLWRFGKFLSYFKEHSSQDQQKTIKRRLIICSMTSQSNFMLIFLLPKVNFCVLLKEVSYPSLPSTQMFLS